MSETLLETRGISKDFSSVYVLNDISIQVIKGEILGIIGENGAGKSTLMKILSGIYTPTSGEILFEGKPVQIHEPLDAKLLGVSLIPQEFNLISQLTVYDNVFLGSELRLRNGLLDKKTMMARTRELLAELNVDIRPEERIENLSTAQKQMVEICKAVSINAKLLIMDEPTTVLTQYEIDILFRLMRRLREQGTTIIYISHKLKEVKAICDRVIILRDGSVISTEQIGSVTIMDMAQRMVGRELNQVFPDKGRPTDDVILEVRELTVPGVIENVSFQLHRGEILGLAGLVGAGRTEVAETILGVREAEQGSILINGKAVRISRPADAVASGISYLSEDRQGSGILVSFSVIKNISLVSLASYCRYILKLILRQKERASAETHTHRFNIKAPSLDTRLEFLSGGNQQKVSLAKSIDSKPAVLIADEPTRGVDVSAKQEIYRLINNLAAEGLACIFISSEQEEIIGMCHRVIVMKQGRVMGSLEGERITEEEIMYLATGIREGVA
ncbi:MAG TPA: sugar ABC transporter ATP-binding protein [Rectinemataceae bacterium]|nr:sugar ABC transporter ATP-binding protein [Rectinemataceae bacterium]